MSSGVKFRAYPTSQQQKVLSLWLDAQQAIYNAKVVEAKQLKLEKGCNFALADEEIVRRAESKQFLHIEQTKEYWNIVPELVLQEGSRRWARSWWAFKKGGKLRPVVCRRSYGKRTLKLSNELFRFYSDTTTKETKLEVGELENPLGVLAFRKSSDFGIPPFKITITSQAGRWYVSFSFGFLSEVDGEGDKEDKLAKNKRQQALLDRMYTKGMGELENIALGVDGCLPVMDSDGVKYDLEPGATRNLEVRERRLRRYKKKIKRMQQGSNRSKRLQAKIDRLAQYRTNVLNDYAKKVSTKLANHPAKILVFEKTDTSSINWRRPQGHSRTKTKITVLTKSKAWKNKLVVVLHPRQPACSPCGAHAPDPVDLRRRAAFSIAHRRYSVQTKKRDEAYREPLLKEAQIVHVGHVEVKCETEYDLTHVRKYLRMLEMLKGVGEPATPEELVRTILWGSREASREAVHNLCLWFKDSDRDDKDVAISKIRRWPHELGFATFTAKLFKKNGIL